MQKGKFGDQMISIRDNAGQGTCTYNTWKSGTMEPHIELLGNQTLETKRQEVTSTDAEIGI
jgi:hypothetical protein